MVRLCPKTLISKHRNGKKIRRARLVIKIRVEKKKESTKKGSKVRNGRRK